MGVYKSSGLISNILGFLLIIGYILPTSQAEFTMNPQMRYNCFFFLDAVALFIILYEGKFDIRRLLFSFFTLFILLIFSEYASVNYVGRLKTGVLLLYGTNIICCNITFSKIKATKFWDTLFMLMMSIILLFCFGTILNIEYLNHFLRIYYVDHLNYFLNNMLLQYKPVSFFVSHSIAAFNYVLFIVVLFIRDRYYKSQVINKVFILGFILSMLFLRSNSSIIFLLILFVMYITYMKKQGKKNSKFLIILLSVLLFTGLVISNIDIIIMILSSDRNGLIGRFSLDGALASSIKFITDINIPTGLYDIKYEGKWLLYIDSSYLINMMRGGVLLLVTYTYVVIRFIKKNIYNNRNLFILFILLFDFGYSFTWEQRFLSGFLFILPYLKLLMEHNQVKTKSYNYI
ncbi:MAG: hypothetical protein J6B91_01505 [Prevotella sp.]|nr:hypothetical protein [Prevotella sp.]